MTSGLCAVPHALKFKTFFPGFLLAVHAHCHLDSYLRSMFPFNVG